MILRSRRARVRLCASVLGSSQTGDLGAATRNGTMEHTCVTRQCAIAAYHDEEGIALGRVGTNNKKYMK